VVDTSLVFPHAKGKPYKRALKTLMAEYLTKIIQENSNLNKNIIIFHYFLFFSRRT
jgi:hypothetical protein